MVNIHNCAVLTHNLLLFALNALPSNAHDETEMTLRSLHIEMVSRNLTMLSSIESRSSPFDPALRGYHAVYRDNEVNRCPGCGRTHWYLGRVLAECAFCSTALPLQESHRHGIAAAPVFRRSRPGIAALDAA